MFKEQNDSAQSEYGAGGGSGKYFKFKEGRNRFRILAGGTPMALHRVNGKYAVCFGIKNGCPYHEATDQKPSLKNVVYVLNKSNVVDGKVVEEIQLAEFPYQIASAVDNLEDDEIWSFTGFPMPYDLMVNATNAGTKEVKYQVTPVPKDKSGELSEEVLEKIKTLNPTDKYVQGKKDKARASVGDSSPEIKTANDVQINDEGPSLDGDINPVDIDF